MPRLLSTRRSGTNRRRPRQRASLAPSSPRTTTLAAWAPFRAPHRRTAWQPVSEMTPMTGARASGGRSPSDIRSRSSRHRLRPRRRWHPGGLPSHASLRPRASRSGRCAGTCSTARRSRSTWRRPSIDGTGARGAAYRRSRSSTCSPCRVRLTRSAWQSALSPRSGTAVAGRSSQSRRSPA